MSRKVDTPAMIKTAAYEERSDPRDAVGPRVLSRAPLKFLVTHGAVGHHMQGEVISEEQLGEADLERLVDLDAITPIPQEDPLDEVRARFADRMTERASRDADKLPSDVTSRNEV